jgi:hypothetical protein
MKNNRNIFFLMLPVIRIQAISSPADGPIKLQESGTLMQGCFYGEKDSMSDHASYNFTQSNEPKILKPMCHSPHRIMRRTY